MKVTDFCDGKGQGGHNLFHNLQAWQPRACVDNSWTDVLVCSLCLMYCGVALQKNNSSLKDAGLLAEDIAH